MPVRLLSEVAPFRWLFCVAICSLLVAFVAAVFLALCHEDRERRESVIAVLDRHLLAAIRRGKRHR